MKQKLEAEYRREYYHRDPSKQAKVNETYWRKRIAAEYDLTPDELDKALTAAKKRKAKKAEST